VRGKLPAKDHEVTILLGTLPISLIIPNNTPSFSYAPGAVYSHLEMIAICNAQHPLEWIL
jgi:hypothetical protein